MMHRPIEPTVRFWGRKESVLEEVVKKKHARSSGSLPEDPWRSGVLPTPLIVTRDPVIWPLSAGHTVIEVTRDSTTVRR